MNTPPETSSASVPEPEKRQSALIWVERFYHNVDNVRGRLQRRAQMVFWLRRILPAVALALVILLVLWPLIGADDFKFRLKDATLPFRSPDQLMMTHPRFVGTDSKGRPFTVTADVATHTSTSRDDVVFENVKADITLNGQQSWIALVADQGVFARTRNELDLRGNVQLFQDQGYELTTTQARVDLKTGQVTSDVPVTGSGPLGHVTAAGMEMSAAGDDVLLRGPARLTYYPPAQRKK